MNKSTHDAGIPLLTEVIAAPQINRVTDKSALPPPASSLVTKDNIQPPAAPRIDGWVEGEWTRLERQISERVLQQILGRIDFVLEQRIRDSLADVLQLTVAGLADEIRTGLQQTLEDVITRAVSQEINRLQSNKK